jgi:hypothetical protein
MKCRYMISPTYLGILEPEKWKLQRYGSVTFLYGSVSKSLIYTTGFRILLFSSMALKMPICQQKYFLLISHGTVDTFTSVFIDNTSLDATIFCLSPEGSGSVHIITDPDLRG